MNCQRIRVQKHKKFEENHLRVSTKEPFMDSAEPSAQLPAEVPPLLRHQLRFQTTGEKKNHRGSLRRDLRWSALRRRDRGGTHGITIHPDQLLFVETVILLRGLKKRSSAAANCWLSLFLKTAIFSSAWISRTSFSTICEALNSFWRKLGLLKQHLKKIRHYRQNRVFTVKWKSIYAVS